MKPLSAIPAGLLLAVLALFASEARSLRAEDVYVTGWAGTVMNDCPPSCPYNLGTSTRSTLVSIACPVPRDRTVFGAAANAAWAVTPTLTNYPGVYRIFVTKGTSTSCPADLMVQVTATGGDSADAGGLAQTNFTTTVFQGTNSVNS